MRSPAPRLLLAAVNVFAKPEGDVFHTKAVIIPDGGCPECGLHGGHDMCLPLALSKTSAEGLLICRVLARSWDLVTS